MADATPSASRESAARELFAAQHGAISLEQCDGLGINKRMRRDRVARGLWLPSQPGAYVLAGAPRSWRQRVMAAVLSAGPEALASHRTAAALWGFEGAAPGVIDVTSGRWHRRPRGEGIVLHESQDLRPCDYGSIAGIPTSSAVRTLIDSGCLVGDEMIDTWLDQGVRLGWLSVARVELRRRQVARRGRNGVGPIRRVLQDRVRNERVTQSGFEVKLSRVVVNAGFVRPERQVKVFARDGAYIGAADLGYPEFRTVMEADSESWHLNRRSFHDDRKRWNRMKAAGFEVLVYTWQHVHREPEHVIDTLTAVLHDQADLLGLDYSKLRS